MKCRSELTHHSLRDSLLAAAVGAMLVVSIGGCASSKSGGSGPTGTTGAATGTTTGTAPEGARGATGVTGTAEEARAATGRRGRADTTTDQAGAASGATGQTGQASTAERTGAAAGATSGNLNDAQILGVVKVANDGEVAAGKLAVRKASAPPVREFAQGMVKDHSEGSKKVDQAAAGTPLSNSYLSSKMVQDANSQIQSLDAQSGTEFDRAYIEAQVKMHQDLLDSIQGKLLPHAQSADVRQLLEQMRDKVSEHLRMAQQLQQQLASVAAR